MRVKTSITLSEKTLKIVDRLAGKESNRSRIIEQAVEAFAAARARSERDARDLEVINRRADALNREVAEALAIQEEL
ncbi:MAG: ribbon-helix-helix protein, CopG family [Deltaproteobacteria bacterium]|nr:ribbon-helix-helix protein, CopG family [Deltaproteobacteria bacterium]